MFAQESVMDVEKEREVFEAYMAEKYKNLMDRRQCLNNGGGYMAWDMNVAWQAWQAAKAQAVPEGFVEKTESNTHHYFKLKDWDEWTCIDGIKDAITSDHDINAIVEVECLEVIEINNKPCFALLAFGKRHGTEVKFFDTEEEAIEAQEPTND